MKKNHYSEIEGSKRRKENKDQRPEVGIVSEGVKAPQHGRDGKHQGRGRRNPPAVLELEERPRLKDKIGRNRHHRHEADNRAHHFHAQDHRAVQLSPCGAMGSHGPNLRAPL